MRPSRRGRLAKMVRDLYHRHRRRARRFGLGSIAVISVGGSMVGAKVMSFPGADGRETVIQTYLPWFMLVGGPVAAFDARGGARDRRRQAEGWARAGIILAVCWGTSAWFWLW